VTGSKKSVAHYGSSEIINDRCTNPTTRAVLRYLKTGSRRMIAEREARCQRRAARIRSLQAGWIGCNSLIPRSKLTPKHWSAYRLNPCLLFRWEWRQFFSCHWPGDVLFVDVQTPTAAGHRSRRSTSLRRFERPSIQRTTDAGGEPPWPAVNGDDWLLIPYIRTKTRTTNMTLRAATVAPKPHPCGLP
jgi:hypothetical protein